MHLSQQNVLEQVFFFLLLYLHYFVLMVDFLADRMVFSFDLDIVQILRNKNEYEVKRLVLLLQC